MVALLSSLKKNCESLLAVFALIRVGNVLMIAGAVYLGAYLAAGNGLGLQSTHLLATAIAASLLAASANVMNDLLDGAQDQINHPNRPLVVGTVKRATAVWLAILLFIAALIATSFLSALHVVLVALIAIMLASYNIWLHRIPLVGNIFIGLIVASSIPFGALSYGLTPTIWIASLFAFGTTVIREISKDLQDVEGDLAVGVRTLPVWMGRTRSVIVVRTVSLLIVALSVVPFLVFSFGGLYLLAMSVTNMLLVLPMARQIGPLQEARFTAATLKWAMLAGMFALSVSNTIPVSPSF